MNLIIFLGFRWPLMEHIAFAIGCRLIKPRQPIRVFEVTSFDEDRAVFHGQDFPSVVLKTVGGKLPCGIFGFGFHETVRDGSPNRREVLAIGLWAYFELNEEHLKSTLGA